MGPGCPWEPQLLECRMDRTLVPQLLPCFPDCPLLRHPVLCLGVLLTHCSCLPVPVSCTWSIMISPSSLTSWPFSSFCLWFPAQHYLDQISMRRNLMGPSTFHMRPLSWALVNLWWAATFSQSFQELGEEDWRGHKMQNRSAQGMPFGQMWWVAREPHEQ